MCIPPPSIRSDWRNTRSNCFMPLNGQPSMWKGCITAVQWGCSLSKIPPNCGCAQYRPLKALLPGRPDSLVTNPLSHFLRRMFLIGSRGVEENSRGVFGIALPGDMVCTSVQKHFSPACWSPRRIVGLVLWIWIPPVPTNLMRLLHVTGAFSCRSSRDYRWNAFT